VTSSHPFWEINKKILRYCLWNVQQMGMAGHPRHSQRVELLLHIIYDNLDSVAGPDLRLQIWDSRAVLATSSVRGEPVSQSVSPSVSQVIFGATGVAHAHANITSKLRALRVAPTDWIRWIRWTRLHWLLWFSDAGGLYLLPDCQHRPYGSRLMRSDMFK